MVKRFFGFLVIAFLLFAQSGSVNAQTYLFSVEETQVNVIINDDGTMAIDYTITFVNDPSADAIDFVDIGIPTSAYNLGCSYC